MSIWAQIGDIRVTAIPPGRTDITTDVYAEFLFCGSGNPTDSCYPLCSVPDGTHIQFLVGKGSPPDNPVSVQEVIDSIEPIEGVSFFDPEGIVEERFVTVENNDILNRHVAKVTLMPVPDQTKDNITVVAYSTYDKIGTAKRLAVAPMTLTISSGEGSFLATTERYDPILNAWTTKAPMPTGRAGPFCGEVGGKDYVIGGYNGNFMSVCEKYDPATDQWTSMTNMGLARGYGCSASYNSEIYCIGGYNYDPLRATSVVEKYTPANEPTNPWTTLAPLPFPLAFGTAQVVGSDIYVFYGATSFDDKDNPVGSNGCVLKYDTVADSWAIVPATYAGAATTTLSSAVPAGSFVLPVNSIASFSASGAVRVGAETLLYVSAEKGKIVLSSPTTVLHAVMTSVTQASLTRTRFAPNSYYDAGTNAIFVFNGYGVSGKPLGVAEKFALATNASTLPGPEPTLPRFSAGQAEISGVLYLVGGSAEQSDFLDQVETATMVAGNVAFSGPSGYDKAPTVRTNAGVAVGNNGIQDYVFLFGGQGNGHEKGWLKLEVQTSPQEVRADGRETSAVSVSATLADGDPAPDVSPSTGQMINFNVRGLLYVQKTISAPADAAAASEKNPIQTVSMLPVLFSSNTMSMTGGRAATILLPRSEDQIYEVQNLANYGKSNEKVVNERELRTKPDSFTNLEIKVGEKRSLYNVAIEVSVDDPFFFGTSDTDATVADQQDQGMSSGAFSFNPRGTTQGRSGNVNFYSDIASIPDIQFVVKDPVGAADAIQALTDLENETPFGASPLYDAMVVGARARNDDTLLPSPPANMMTAASDNEDSGSSSSAQDVADEANSVDGQFLFPAFVTTFVVTDPISLAARKERTDVADLELISSETGGNSFTVERSTYIPFVIDRIKTSAPSSMGSGSVTMEHDIDGSLYGFSFVAGNMISGNLAQMTVEYSSDGYNWVQIDTALQAPNGAGDMSVTYVLGTPVEATKVRYQVKLSSKTFQSPVLKSATIRYIKPNEQYLFTYPQTVGGQVSELAAATNERLPTGGEVDVGFSHGASLEFDRDYVTSGQPKVSERGTIKAVSRDFSPVLNGVVFREKMTSEDLLVYKAPSGSWAQDAVTRIYVNEQEALVDDFLAVPEDGKVVFRKKLSSDDEITIEVQNPSAFRVGLKVSNPSLLYGVLDSFAFMWGETNRVGGLKPNKPPRALNLFITPEPVVPGGPIEANYTFVDPDGDDEDKDQTQIMWFRNGLPVSELANKRTISNSDFVARRADAGNSAGIARGQEWFFTVRPSDGKSFGALATSHSIVVSNQAPVATSAYLRSSNAADPATFTSSDSITAVFTFADADDDSSTGSVFTFYGNGVQIKSGTEDTINAADTDDAGNKILVPGKSVYAEIVPFDGTDYGTLVATAEVVIQPTPPTVSDVSIIPIAPTASGVLTLTYQYVSLDESIDQSRTAWFKNGERQSAYDNQKNIGTIGQGASTILRPGDKWYAVVTPYDGNVEGQAVKSNTVLIHF